MSGEKLRRSAEEYSKKIVLGVENLHELSIVCCVSLIKNDFFLLFHKFSWFWCEILLDFTMLRIKLKVGPRRHFSKRWEFRCDASVIAWNAEFIYFSE